ncbi:DoxX family protein [Nocardia sp. NPDC047648]|uniref:DoxX family protein n=1 Tax=Nocardia sp. NPDC047648 TaxID=3155625 RepID=UPI0033EC6531
MEIVVLLGRILFCAIFLAAGIGQLAAPENGAQQARARRIRFSTPAMVRVAGAVQILGGTSVLLGIWGDIGSLLLLLFLIPATVIYHAFWDQPHPMDRAAEQAHFMKNLSLCGAAIVMFGLFAGLGQDLGMTLSQPLIRL